MTAWMRFLVVVGGAALVGAFIFYGQRKTEKPRSIAAERKREAATREVYERADRADQAR